MSTKTTFKRVALVTVAALGFGVLTTVVPAQAAVATTLNAAVGPNGATSLTVVGGDTDTTGALIRLDVTNDETVTPVGGGLGTGDTIVGSVTAVPTTVLAKTLAANGGSVADTSLAPGLGRSDFVMLESIGQTAGVPATTAAATTTSINSDWTKTVPARNSTTNLDTATVNAAAGADGSLSSANTGYNNKDGITQVTTGVTTKSYYVTIKPRTGSDVIDRGAYTFSFQLINGAGIVISTKTVKIDFVSAAAKTDATVTLNPVGTFLAASTLAPYDSATATSYASLTLRNRDGGLIRNFDGAGAMPTARLQISTSAAPGYVDTMTLTLNDSGTYGADFGTDVAPIGGGSLQSYDGIYGIVGALPAVASSAVAGSVVAYRWWAGYGNATLLTPALTLYGSTIATGLTANPALTTVATTAAGMLAGEDAAVTLSAAKNYNVPTTTKTATLKFTVISSGTTPVGGALITVTPTWSGPMGTALVSPVTSTTGTVYTTDALGQFSVTVTNSSPIDTAKLTLVLSGAVAFGTGTNTVSVTFQAPVATTIAIADPVSGISVLSGSTNVTTVIVKDQFGNPVKDQAVTVSATQTPAVVSTTVITPIVTGAAGTATYSYTPAAATTSAVLSFNTTPTAVTAATLTYTYVATLPVVATLTGYFDRSWATTPATLVPATGIYSSAGATTPFVLEDARNMSKAFTATADGNTTNDENALLFTGLTSAGVSATGASVTVTAGTGGWIIDASGAPAKSRTFAVTATGTAKILVLATGTGAITFTATSGTVTATASMWVAGRLATDNSSTAGRFVKVTSAATGTANGTGTPVTVAVTDRYGNPVSGVALNVVASGVGSFMGGAITQSFITDASGTYTFLATTQLSDGGVAKFTATTGTVGSFLAAAATVGSTDVDSTLAAGNASASAEITFAAGSSATDVAQAATDAAAEATDAANAATDAANAAAEAADAATAAAQDAADAVAALSTQVSEMIDALKKQITALTNLVIKIQKKVKA